MYNLLFLTFRFPINNLTCFSILRGNFLMPLSFASIMICISSLFLYAFANNSSRKSSAFSSWFRSSMSAFSQFVARLLSFAILLSRCQDLMYLTGLATIKNHAIPMGTGQYQAAVANKTILLVRIGVLLQTAPKVAKQTARKRCATVVAECLSHSSILW